MRTSHWKLFPGFLAGLLVMWVTACGVMLLLAANPGLLDLHWGIWLAVTLLFPVLALVAHLKAGSVHALYLVSYFLNTLGAGCTFGVVMSYLDVEPSGGLMLALLLSVLPAALMMLVLCLLYAFLRWDRGLAITFTILGLVAAVVGAVTLGPGALFAFLFFLPMPLACAKTLGKPWSVDRYLSFSGFGAYLLVMVAGVMILTEDGPDGLFDFLFEGVGDVALDAAEQKKQRQPRR